MKSPRRTADEDWKLFPKRIDSLTCCLANKTEREKYLIHCSTHEISQYYSGDLLARSLPTKKHFWRFNKKKAENNFNISIDFTRRFFYLLSCLIFCSMLHKGVKLNAELRQWWLRDMRSIFSSLLCENLWLASQHFSPRIRHISCLHVCFTCAEHERALKHLIFVGRFGRRRRRSELWHDSIEYAVLVSQRCFLRGVIKI